ncbi:hypothetical protein ACPV5Q_20250 [Vibrio astriarenae]
MNLIAIKMGKIIRPMMNLIEFDTYRVYDFKVGIEQEHIVKVEQGLNSTLVYLNGLFATKAGDLESSLDMSDLIELTNKDVCAIKLACWQAERSFIKFGFSYTIDRRSTNMFHFTTWNKCRTESITMSDNGTIDKVIQVEDLDSFDDLSFIKRTKLKRAKFKSLDKKFTVNLYTEHCEIITNDRVIATGNSLFEALSKINFLDDAKRLVTFILFENASGSYPGGIQYIEFKHGLHVVRTATQYLYYSIEKSKVSIVKCEPR